MDSSDCDVRNPNDNDPDLDAQANAPGKAMLREPADQFTLAVLILLHKL